MPARGTKDFLPRGNSRQRAQLMQAWANLFDAFKDMKKDRWRQNRLCSCCEPSVSIAQRSCPGTRTAGPPSTNFYPRTEQLGRSIAHRLNLL